jgi:hypothetical protein
MASLSDGIHLVDMEGNPIRPDESAPAAWPAGTGRQPGRWRLP